MPDSTQAILILVITLPGFLGYLLFNRLSSRCIEDAFEKVGFVVLFNVTSIFVVRALNLNDPFGDFKSSELSYNDVTSFVTSSFIILSAITALTAILLAFALDSKIVSDLLIKSRLTRKTSSKSVVADVIRTHPDCFMKFRFKGGGYVVGHPRRYCLDGSESVIFLEKAARRPAKQGTQAQRPLEDIGGPGVLILNFDDISLVEVLDGVD